MAAVQLERHVMSVMCKCLRKKLFGTHEAILPYFDKTILRNNTACVCHDEDLNKSISLPPFKLN